MLLDFLMVIKECLLSSASLGLTLESAAGAASHALYIKPIWPFEGEGLSGEVL